MQELTQEQLDEIAEALNKLARHGVLYGGFRRKQRRIVEVRLTKHLVVKYDSGELRYLNPATGKTYHFYVHIPPKS